jgi:ABC-2 type transport system permease protein
MTEQALQEAPNVAPGKKPSKPALPVRLWRSLRSNPIILKELRYRMRSWRGLFDVAFFSFLLSILGLLIYNSSFNSSRSFYSTGYGYTYSYGVTRSQELGTNYFLAIVVAQLFIIGILAPGLSSNTIANEKERQTYDVMLVTLLKPIEIVTGKLFAALSYLLLVVLAGIPIASVAFLMGGVGPEEIAMALVILVLSCIMVGCIGVFWSARVRTAREATRNTFLTIIAIGIALPFGLIIGANLLRTGRTDFTFQIYSVRWWQDLISWVFSANPVYALLATQDIIRFKPGSNIFYFANNPGDFFLTPFSRFLIIATLTIAIFFRLAVMHIKPTRTNEERGGFKRRFRPERPPKVA